MKKPLLYTFLLILIGHYNYGQKVTVTDYRVKYSDIKKKAINYSDEIGENSLIIFPIIKTENQKIERKIQFEILKSLQLDTLLINYPIKTIVDSSAFYGLTSMNYQISFNKNDLISLTIVYHHCGANCWTTKVFLNFNISNGKLITINDIINPLDKDIFNKQVLKNKQTQLTLFKDSLINQFDTLKSNDEKGNYKYIIEEVENCEKSVYLDEFLIKENTITFYDKCFWAYYLSDYEPELYLTYDLRDNSKYFKIDFIEMVTKK